MGEHPSGQCGPMPEDPFPDLTLLEFEPVEIRNGVGEIIQLIPARVAMVQILTRNLDGTPALVQLL